MEKIYIGIYVDGGRGCLMIIWTGQNTNKGIIKKKYEWPSWYIAKMILQSGSVWEKDSLIAHNDFISK